MENGPVAASCRKELLLETRWRKHSCVSVFSPSLANQPVHAEHRAAVSLQGESPHTIRTGNDSFTCSQHSPALHPDSAPAALWESRASTTASSPLLSSLASESSAIFFSSLLFCWPSNNRSVCNRVSKVLNFILSLLVFPHLYFNKNSDYCSHCFYSTNFQLLQICLMD